MNVRLLMSDMGIPPLRLSVYHETASGFLGAVLNRSESRSSLSLHHFSKPPVSIYGSFFRCETAPWKYSYMLGGMVSLCSLAMCLRTVSEYIKRSPQMRQCH
jgi:hypothetical protein